MSLTVDAMEQCFPNFFACWHNKKAKQILWLNSQMNQFMLITNSITVDREKGDDLFFLEITTFSGIITRSLTSLTVIHSEIYSIFPDKY